MTFYEAALRVLEGAGRPLHVDEITQQSVQQNLLSHVGKMPEQTMLSRLSAMARRPRDRRVVVTGKDTFALSEWQLPEDVEALAQMGQPEPNPEELQPPLRPPERHPEPRAENVRAAGRGAERKRREEDDARRRKRRFPPTPEVVFEILSEAEGPLLPQEIAERARSRELAGEGLSNEQILTSLLEDNQRRIDAGRRPQFILVKETGAVALERAGAPSEAPPLELQAAFAQALGIPLEGGRPVLPRRPDSASLELPEGTSPASVRQTARDARRAVARLIRKRLAELDAGTFERSCVRMLQGNAFREIKVAKRSKDGPLVTARKREGSVELRFAVRFLRGSLPVDRRAVQELRKDLGHYSAQVGLMLSAGDVRGDARGEATSSGSLVMLWCGDALGEKFLDAEAGVTVTHVEIYELDERFFELARIDAIEAQRRREERQRERQLQGDSPASEPNPPGAEAPLPSAEAPPVAAEGSPPAPVDQADEGDDDGEDEEGGEEDLEAAESFAGSPDSGPRGPGNAPGPGGVPGGGRRRRRRRRGRRGRGPRPEGAPPAPGGAEAGAPSAPEAPAAAAAPQSPPPPSSSDGGSQAG
jgi:ribonuclease E